MRLLLLAVVTALFFPFFRAQAADTHWTGTTSTTWGTGTNWDAGKPAAGDNAVFNGTFSNQPNLVANQSAGGIWMTGAVGQDVTISSTGGILTLNGNTIAGNAGLGLLVDNANAFKLTITAPVKVGGAQTWTNNSSNVVTFGAGGVDLNNKTLTINGTGNFLVSGVISTSSGSGALVKSGNGILTLSGTNTFTGASTINGGTVIINSSSSLGASTSATINAGTLEVAATFSTTRNFLLGSATSTVMVDPTFTFTATGVFSGSGALNKTGSGTMILGGANTYTGGTNVSAGTLQISASERLVNTGNLTVSGGTFDVQTFSETVANVTLSSGSITGSGAGTLTGSSFAVQSGTATAILAGSGATLTKTTSGTVTLSGANTFTGATTVSSGTLTLSAGSGNSALGATSSVTVNSGGTVLLGASNQIKDTAPMTLAGGTFAKGNFSEGAANSPGVGALTLTASGSQIDFGTGSVGVLTFASFSPGAFTLTIANWTGTVGTMGSGTTDRLIFASDQSANLGSFSFNGYVGAVEFALAGGYFEVVPAAPVPETSTWVAAALAVGAVGLHFGRRRRARTRRS